jgi:hypothetical protein
VVITRVVDRDGPVRVLTVVAVPPQQRQKFVAAAAKVQEQLLSLAGEAGGRESSTAGGMAGGSVGVGCLSWRCEPLYENHGDATSMDGGGGDGDHFDDDGPLGLAGAHAVSRVSALSCLSFQATTVRQMRATQTD